MKKIILIICIGIFTVLGTLDFYTVLTREAPRYEEPWMQRKIRNKFLMNGIIAFGVAGYLATRYIAGRDKD